MKENKFRNTETMKAIATAITAQKEFCELYSLTNANMNSNVEQTNRVTTIAETVELSREIIDTTHLQNDFFNAVSRITVWVDSNAIVIFVGAVFAVHARLAESEKAQKERFTQLFKESIDEKYNQRKLKNKTITALTETRHTFDSLETFTEFFNLLSQFVVARKKALSETENSKQNSKKENSKKEKAENSKQKENSKNNKQKEQKAEKEKAEKLTKEIIEKLASAK